MAQGILQLHEPGAAIDIEPREIGIHPPPDVIIIPPHPPFRPPRPPRVEILPAELSSLELGVEIDGQIAKTTLDQTFRNPNNRTLEGTYLFPLPADAAVQNLSLYIDGKPVKCEVLEAKKAREIYEGIVRQMRDPALLEYVDRDLVKLRIFPIEAGQTRRVRFEYSQVLKRDFGLTEYGFPLVARQQREAPIKSVTVVGSIRSDVPMTNLYCPTHELDIVKRDDKYAKFSFEKQNYKPAENLKIFYTVSTKDLGAGLLTFREKDQDGYFMLMIAPREELEEKKILPKDVTFVLDTSGSMSGDKIVQARKALVYCLNSLKAEDRFNVVRFSTESESFSTSLLNASSENVKKGIEFVERFHAAGGTAIQAALQDALKGQTEPGRPHLVVFLTDGMPTIGETNTDRIIDSVKQTNEKRARVFTFGVGHDVNTRLLDTLGEQNGGVSEYVAPQEDIEVKVSNFFSRVSDPVLTDLKIDFGSARVSKQYPSEIHDLFTGSQVKIIGRYSNSGKSTILLKGRMGEKEKAYEHVLDFPEESGSADFLPRLWAIRRVGYLTDNIRKGGEDKELDGNTPLPRPTPRFWFWRIIRRLP
jgi:Ca-activated chloride channel family protein